MMHSTHASPLRGGMVPDQESGHSDSYTELSMAFTEVLMEASANVACKVVQG